MKFRELAEVFGRLQLSTGRLGAVHIVADLLGRAFIEELKPMVYLLQGQLRPAYEGVEFGVGERLLLRVVARTSEATETVVVKRYKKLGDLGLVAESLGKAPTQRPLSIRQVHAALIEVARAAGVGAAERKTRLLAEPRRRATALEARYRGRIVQGRLRLGIGDATILEAAAAGALGDRGWKDLIEQAYNVRSDLGGVVRLAYSRGARELARVGPKVGIPVRPALAQRLPSA